MTRLTISLRRRSGFTLLELVVVIIVLGLLAGIVAPQIIGRLSEARFSKSADIGFRSVFR